MVLSLSTPPVIEPVLESELRDHLRVSDDAMIYTYLRSARQYVENLCGPLITQTWVQYEDAWPDSGVLKIGKPRLQTVSDVKYTDEDGVQSTLSATMYTVQTTDEFHPSIVLKDDEEWPGDVLFNVQPIAITFICGYGDVEDDIPEPIRLAIMLLVGNWYENREATLVSQFGQSSIVTVPFTVDALLAEYRMW